MNRDTTNKASGRVERFPASRRLGLFAPWFDDIYNRDESAFPFSAADRALAPAVDIEETSDEYMVSADLPGIKKEDISIECVGSQLTISAERKYESPEGRKQDHQERFYGMYQRSFTLPSGVDADKIEASCESGVLTIHIPKAEKAKARRIEIGDKVPNKQSMPSKE